MARPINKESVNLAQAERCTETQGTMWRDDPNSRHARSLNATTRAEKSSIVLGECSTQNVYSVLPASHENVDSNKCLLDDKIINPSEISIEFDSSKNSLKNENCENKNLNFKLVGYKNLKKEICSYKIFNQNLSKSKDLEFQNCKYRKWLNKIKMGNCKMLNQKLYKAKDLGFRSCQHRKWINKIIEKQKWRTKDKIKKFSYENNSPIEEMLKDSSPHKKWIWLNRNLENKISKHILVKNLENSKFISDKNKIIR